MEVISKIKDETIIPFSQINEGELFCMRNNFFLKIEKLDVLNAVNIATGKIVTFGENAKVVPLKAKIITESTVKIIAGNTE